MKSERGATFIFYSLTIVQAIFSIHLCDATEVNTEHTQRNSKPLQFASGKVLIEHDERRSKNYGVDEIKVKTTAADGIPSWDTNGYVLFCPCMGRFGNQMEQLIGGLAFAKAINRTLILPPMREGLSSFTTFTDWFQIDPFQDVHRVIRGEDFMEHYSEIYWHVGSRMGYCRDYVVAQQKCKMKHDMPKSAFWDYFNISDFDGIYSFDLIDEVDFSIESEVRLLHKQWKERFPGSEHPVLAMYNVPGSFPSLPGNKFLQKYFKWNSSLLAEADRIKKQLFRGESYLGIHLRVGEDWDRVCQNAVGMSSMYFASPQCKSPSKGRIFQEMCYPSVEDIMSLTREAMETFGLKHLYIASDEKPYKEEFTQTLRGLNVSVHHYNPKRPQMDLIILGEADYFIGNCISTFTSFIKRERDVRGHPSTFWGYPV